MAIHLAPAEQAEQAAVSALVVKARDELSRLLGVAAPDRMQLTFHATPDAYERATGQLSFTSTAERDGAMHFLPVRLLRDRGILDRTIRRALIRAMTAPYLTERRAWVREGAALYFAEPPAADAPREPRVTCPADVDLERPVSAGALSAAYARARSCFARQAGSGRDWREIR